MIDVLDAIDEYGLEVVQLHGDETPEMCEDLSSEVEVIKAFRIDNKKVTGAGRDQEWLCLRKALQPP